MMDLTVREIDAFACGHDQGRRAVMAEALWHARETAIFMGFIQAGKRPPDITSRVRKIMGGSEDDDRRRSVGSVIARMNEVARRAGMPPPRPRAKTK